MPSSNTLPLGGYRALQFRRINDPGAGNTFGTFAKDWAYVEVVTATGETRVLPAASAFLTETVLRVTLADDGGDLTITGADQVPILQDVYDTVEFTVKNDLGVDPEVKAWRLTYDSRAGENATETKSVELPINNAVGNGLWTNSVRVALSASASQPNASVIVGTHGTDNPLIRATETVAANTKDQSAICSFVVPDDYVAGGLLTLTLTIVEGTTCGSADLEVNAFNRDAPTSNIVASGASTSVLTGATVVATLTGTLVAPGDTIDVEINFELTDTGTLTPVYDLTRAILSYTGNAG